MGMGQALDGNPPTRDCALFPTQGQWGIRRKPSAWHSDWHVTEEPFTVQAKGLVQESHGQAILGQRLGSVREGG